MTRRKPGPVDTVNISPGVSVLSVLSHLNYRPWFALAEFVDNSIQSFLDNRAALEDLEGADSGLHVAIEVDSSEPAQIVVRDNAAGIGSWDFPRAFRPAQLPPDRSGLCEFGMGMKSAACWFAPRWSVRTSALGESIEHSIEFDIAKIIRDSVDELSVEHSNCPETTHFTEIALRDLHHVPVGRTLGKIRAHLSDIYRVYTRGGLLELKLNGEVLSYEAPEILVAPHYRDLSGEPIEWQKQFEFDFGSGLRAHGFAAIRKTASTSRAGFALFRRNRLIQGSGDEGYRPEYLVGKPNSFAFQRVFGEVHLDGFEVSHTKDGFQWDENEQPFLELLKEELTKKDLPLLQQAREYRVERATKDLRKGAEEATRRTSESIRDSTPPVISGLLSRPEAPDPPKELGSAYSVSHRVVDVELHGDRWRIVLELSNDPSVGDWFEISDEVAEMRADSDTSRRTVGVRMSLCHPFMQRFCGPDCDDIEPLLRIVAALGLSEVVARDSGVRQAGAIRRNVNALVRALSTT